MSKQNDGGSVFPTPLSVGDVNHSGDGPLWITYDHEHGNGSGMSLRDYIAIHASDDDVRDFNVRRNNGQGPLIGRPAARYSFADAMLKARETDHE